MVKRVRDWWNGMTRPWQDAECSVKSEAGEVDC